VNNTKINVEIYFGTAYMETRHIREGKALVFEGRTKHVSRDGKIEFTKWERSVEIPNYGDVYDDRPSLKSKMATWLHALRAKRVEL